MSFEVHSYEKERCKVSIWHDDQAENPNDWNGSEVCVVTFDRHYCWMTSEGKHGMGISSKEDVQQYLPWTQDVPPQPGPEPEEPDPDDYGDDAEGQAEYDAHYAQWEDELQKHAEAAEAYEPYEEWEDQYIEGYRVFTVSAYVHSGVALYFGDEIDYHEEEAFDDSYGFVIIRCASFERDESLVEEFSRIANGVQKEDTVRKAAESHFDLVSQYVSGSVYGFTVTFPDGEDDSCGGFYGDYDSEHITEEINGHINWWVNKVQQMEQVSTPDQRAELVRQSKLREAERIIAEGDEAVLVYLSECGFDAKTINRTEEVA